MYHIKNDKRVITSAELIYRGLLNCVHRKDFDSITVTELVEEAGVGKATFYRLFDKKDDVLLYACDKCFDELLSSYAAVCQSGEKIPVIKYYVDFLERRKELLEVLISLEKLNIIAASHKKAIEKYSEAFFSDMVVSSDEYVCFICMRTGLLISFIYAWMLTGRRLDENEIFDLMLEQIKSFEEKAFCAE